MAVNDSAPFNFYFGTLSLELKVPVSLTLIVTDGRAQFPTANEHILLPEPGICEIDETVFVQVEKIKRRRKLYVVVQATLEGVCSKRIGIISL
jgi:hypothetical protein